MYQVDLVSRSAEQSSQRLSLRRLLPPEGVMLGPVAYAKDGCSWASKGVSKTPYNTRPPRLVAGILQIPPQLPILPRLKSHCPFVLTDSPLLLSIFGTLVHTE